MKNKRRTKKMKKKAAEKWTENIEKVLAPLLVRSAANWPCAAAARSNWNSKLNPCAPPLSPPRNLSRVAAAEQLPEWDAAQHLIFAFPYLTFRSLAVFTFSFFFAIFPFVFFFRGFLLLFFFSGTSFFAQNLNYYLQWLSTCCFLLHSSSSSSSSNFCAIFRCPQLLPELPRRSLLISFGIFSSVFCFLFAFFLFLSSLR